MSHDEIPTSCILVYCALGRRFIIHIPDSLAVMIKDRDIIALGSHLIN